MHRILTEKIDFKYDSRVRSVNSSIYLHVFICTAHAQFIGIKGKIPSFYGIRGLNRGLNRGFGKIHGFSSPLLVNRNSVNPWILPNPWTKKSTDFAESTFVNSGHKVDFD